MGVISLRAERRRVQDDINNIKAFLDGDVRQGKYQDVNGEFIIHQMREEDKPRARRTLAQLQEHVELLSMAIADEE